MQTQNLLEQPRIQGYSPKGSENAFGAVNQQTMQPLAKAMTTLAEEVGCKVPEATNGHLSEMMVWSNPTGDGAVPVHRHRIDMADYCECRQGTGLLYHKCMKSLDNSNGFKLRLKMVM